jgi:phage repressor protein C with HTH and peptisase S24 domain
MLLSLLKANGHSMEPKIKDGSFFLISSIPFLVSKPRINDTIVFKFENKIIVKKIHKIEKEEYFIQGENLKDSKKFEPITKNEILGKVIWVF